MQTNLTIDKYGSLGQIQPDGSIDGGDSVNWEGHRSYLQNKRTYGLEPYRLYYYKEFFKRNYGYIRHPHSPPTSRYYLNPWNGNISRDQLQGILAYHIKHQDHAETFKIFLHHGAWLWLFAYNTVRNGDTTFGWKWPDLTIFDIWAMYIRGFRPISYILYPLLCVLDLHMLLATIVFNYEEKIKPVIYKVLYYLSFKKINLKYKQDDDQISFAIKSIAQREFMPTPISVLSWKILNKEKLKSLVYEYWSGWRQNSGMYLLYENKIKELE